MSRIVVLGAGISGHTAALHLRRMLGRKHTVTVVSPNADWNWIPSNIWVGVGQMEERQVTFPLAPVYARKGIEFIQARAVALRPEGDDESSQGAVDVVSTAPGEEGREERLLIGMGHGTCTCEGAAFEYTFNVDHALREAGVRDLAEVVYITNEAALGDFGVGEMVFQQQGFETTSKTWTESLFRERGVRAILGAHIQRVEEGVAYYEQLDGSEQSIAFDFAMLLPPFRGAGLPVYDATGEDITDRVNNPGGFMKVDADYTPKSPEQWRAEDWPKTYESVGYARAECADAAHGRQGPRRQRPSAA